MADDVLYQGVKGVTDLMVRPGIINLDFADVRDVMDEMGKAMMGTGEADGENRALQAAEKAIANPLLDEISLRGAKGVLINITGGTDLTLFELDEAANRIREEVDPDANIIVGSTLDIALEGKIRVSVVATGIDAADSDFEGLSSRRSQSLDSAEELSVRIKENALLTEPVNSQYDEPNLFGNLDQSGSNFSQNEDLDYLRPEEQVNEAFNVPLDLSEPQSEFLERQEQIMETNIKDTIGREKTEPKRFGINSLIGRMTGVGSERSSQDSYIEPDLSEPGTILSDDDDRIEVPAFLRRQAN
jgi:cell division protein FtsZ